MDIKTYIKGVDDEDWEAEDWYKIDAKATVTKAGGRSSVTTFLGHVWSDLKQSDTSPNAGGQVVIAHEFGHMIGLDHPSHGVKGVKPNSAQEYCDPPGHPNAGKPSKSIMGVGMDLLEEHFESWREKVDDEIDSKCGPFKAVVK